MLNINKKKELIKNNILKNNEIMDLIISINNNSVNSDDRITERYYLKFINVKYNTFYKNFQEIIKDIFFNECPTSV